MKNKRDRVVFYSKHDGAIPYNLENAAGLLSSIDFNDKLDLNDLLELFNVKLYFDNELYLTAWNDTKRQELKNLAERGWILTKDFWVKNINSDNILAVVQTLEFKYRSHFWELTNLFQTYKKINRDTFSEVLTTQPNLIRNVLLHERLVAHFSAEIRNFLLGYDKGTELLLSKYAEHHSNQSPSYFFPNSLSLTDKENILSNYIDSNEPNLNYIWLIEILKDTDQLKISSKTRLKAKRQHKKMTETLLDTPTVSKNRIAISAAITKNQEKPVASSRPNGGELEITYSAEIIDDLVKQKALTEIFKNLFGYVDPTGMATLVSKESQLSVLERIGMRSKSEYLTGYTFVQKDLLSLLQIAILYRHLNSNDNSIETLITYFINEQLNRKLDGATLCFRPPTRNSTYLEKIRSIAPEFESLLKQYKFFVEDGAIDFELIGIDSKPLQFSSIKSGADKKYIYTTEDASINYLMHVFFSDQGYLGYTKSHGDKYSNFFDLITNEDIKLDDFEEYQKQEINQLVTEGFLQIVEGNHIIISKNTTIFILGELYYNEAISYWHYPGLIQNVIDDMIDSGLLRSESTLFTRQEIAYFNFFLNKKEFTNGLDLRNKYLHGTNSDNEETHKSDYFRLLRLIILATLKIEDDLNLGIRANQL